MGSKLRAKAASLTRGRLYRTTAGEVVRFDGFDLYGFVVAHAASADTASPAGGPARRLMIREIVGPVRSTAPIYSPATHPGATA